MGEPSNNNSVLEKLARLQRLFYEQLPDKLYQLETYWQQLRQGEAEHVISDFHRAAHGLAGAAGTFGAITVGTVARELEMALKPMLGLGNKSSIRIDAALVDVVDGVLARLRQAAQQWHPNKNFQLIPDVESESRREFSDLIYLLEDDVLQAEKIRVNLEYNDFHVRCFSRLVDFERACDEQLPAAIVMDMVLDEGCTAGAKAIEVLKQRFSICPPVVFISVRTDIEARLAAARAGALRYFSKPLDLDALTQTLNGLTRQVTSPYHVLIIDDDEQLLEYYATILRQAGMDVRTLNKPLEGLAVLDEYQPDLLLMDVYMPDCSGPELAQVIRQDDHWAQMPIMFLSTEQDLSRQLDAMNLGGDDFLTKPVTPGHLVSAVTARAQRARWVTRLNRDLKRSLRNTEYSNIILGQHAIVSITDVAGIITYANDKFCQISGYSREELLGQNHRILKSKQHSDSFYKELWQTISSGLAWSGIICNYDKGGNEYWVESTIVPILDGHGRPYQYVSARTDITALRASEERLKRSQAFANMGTWDWNVQSGGLYWSDCIAPLLGYRNSIPDTTYENFIAAVHPDDRQKVIAAITACIEHGEDYNIEHRVVWDNGEVHWLLERGDVVRSPDGQPLHMLGLVQDITQMKNAQFDLLRNRVAMDGSVDGIAILNSEGVYVYLNPAYAQIYGFGVPDDLIGKQWTSLYPDNELKIFNEKIMPLFEKEGFWRGETVGTKQDGSSFPQSLSLSALTDGGLVYVVRDISSDKQVRQALVQAKEDAEKANRSKSQFLSSMSHELRTPLNAIIGFSQLLQMTPGESLSDVQMDNVNEILKASKHLLKLVNEVLDLSKVEAGSINLSIEAVIIPELVNDCLALIKQMAHKRGIEISFLCNGAAQPFGLCASDLLVMADRTRLKQVLLNLFSNAVKYNSENGHMEIYCSVIDDNNIRLGVTDTGAGIPLELQPQLFTAFNRIGAEQQDIEGTGIGLVITKNIVEMMGGKIGFVSDVGKGSDFWVDLPRAKRVKNMSEVQQSSDGKARNISQSLPIDRVKEKHSILYIEDNPANFRLVAQVLSLNLNVQLLGAEEATQGLVLAKQHRPDLILMDISLPGMSGIEALKLLRQDPVTRKIPVIAVSANAMDKDIEIGFKEGFDDYITKPIEVKKMLQVIGCYLDATATIK